ncbi:MAG: hypothetical protein M1823_004900 [Watsoniomyces obsoletus]|nr:MAG: hypothetical protein M1823_004900 [Watsoniomyces obsoletus]
MGSSKGTDVTTTLKSVLRFLLPTIGQEEGMNPISLISLLCLDWVNTELDLGLDFKDIWQVKTNSSNIIVFFLDCFAVDEAFGNLKVDLAEVEALIISAIRYVDDSHNEEKAGGKQRLHEIVKRLFESSNNSLDWVSACKESILRMFIYGPSEKLLEHCQRKNDRLQQDRNNRNTEEEDNRKQKDNEDFGLLGYRDDDDDYDDYDDGSGFEDNEPMKDLTACDKECGYCGTCDY